MLIYLSLILLILFIYLAGSACYTVSSISIQEVFMRVSYKLISGLLLSVSIYSVIITKFATINLVVLAVTVFLLVTGFTTKQFAEKQLQLKAELKPLLLIVSTAVFFSLLMQWSTSYFSSAQFKFPFIDYSFYSMVSAKLNSVKVESNIAYYNDFGFIQKNALPYHYFELWINSMMLFFTSLPAMKLYVYVIIPLLGALGFSSLTAFSAYFRKPGLLTYLFIIFLLTYTVSFPPFHYAGPHPENIFYYQKHWSAIVVLPVAYLLYKQGWKNHAFALALLLPVFNIVFLPIMGIVFLVLFLALNKEDKWLMVKYGAFIVGYILVFYFILNKPENLKNTGDPLVLKKYVTDFLTRGFIYAKMLAIYLSPYFALYLFNVYKKGKSIDPILFLMLLLAFAGILSSAIFCFYVDSWQFPSITLIPSSYFFLVLLFNKLDTKKLFYWPSVAFIFLMLCGSAYYTFVKRDYTGFTVSRDFLNKVNGYIENHPVNPNGCFYIKGFNLASDWANPHYYRKANPIGMVTQNYSTTCVNVPGDEQEYRNTNILYRQSPIGKFVDASVNGKIATGFNDIQLDFLRKNNVNYVILENNNDIPEHWKPFIRETFVDPYTHMAVLFIQVT